MTSLLDSASLGERPDVKAEDAAEEFEIVIGRKQIASLGLLAMVLLAVFSGVSYLIGKSVTPKPAAPEPAPVSVEVPAPPAPPPAALEVPAQPPPLFADPIPGAVYLQMGAVEKGAAAIWVEGLRTHNLRAFVAPGPSEKIFRVLIGPLSDPAAYREAKNAVGDLGLTSFARRYETK